MSGAAITYVTDADATWLGEGPDDIFGSRGAVDGDADGDGRPDLVVTAPHANAAGRLSGSVYLFPHPEPGMHAAGDAAVVLTGASSGEWAGISVSWVPDVDGDGADELLVGARASDKGGEKSGRVYLVHRPLDGPDGSLDGAALSLLGAAPGDQLGAEVASPGDVDGDGVSDVWLGAPYGAGASGKVFLVSGDLTGTLAVDDVAIAWWYSTGAGDLAGLRLGAKADVNGDGRRDVGIGAEGTRDGAGTAYLITEPGTGVHDLRDADRVLTGLAPGDSAGSAVHLLDDLDGDGVGDVAVQARGAAADGLVSTGVVYLLAPDAASLTDTRLTLTGEASGDDAGAHAESCDLDGDGVRDLVLTAHSAGVPGPETGPVYIFFGPLPAGALSVGDADVILAGYEPIQRVGQDVSCADLDADGRADLWIGAEGTTAGLGPYTGAAHLFFGFDGPGGGATPAPGAAVDPAGVGDRGRPPAARRSRGGGGCASAAGAAPGWLAGLAAWAAHRRRRAANATAPTTAG